MKRIHIFLILALFFITSTSSYAQLKIVGVNADAPESKINYLDNPVSAESFLIPYDCSKPKFSMSGLPNNELLYLSDTYEFGYRINNDSSSLVLGVPAGYYRVSGCYIFKEEYDDIHRKAMNLYDENKIIYTEGCRKLDRYYERQRVEAYIWDFKITKAEFQKLLDESKHPYIEVALYTLTNEKGEDYFVRVFFFRDAKYVMVDYVSYLEKLYKGKDLYFHSFNSDYDYVKDVYTGQKVPISVPDSHSGLGGIFFSSQTEVNDYLKKVINNKAYHCTDILVDGDREIAVIEDNEGNKFSITLGEEYSAKYSAFMFDNEGFKLVGRRIQGEDRMIFFTKDQTNQFVADYKRLIAKKNSAQTQRDQELAQQKETRRKELAQKYGNEMAKTIVDHKLAIGMTKEMCMESIGYPTRRYKTTSEYGEVEVFVYAYMAVFFTDGKLSRVDEVN